MHSARRSTDCHNRSRPVRALFTLTIFLGSALLFLIQPMVAKMVLPVFGGTPAVWNASVVFFQLMLLVGYAYAHGSAKLFGGQRQPIVHLLVLGVALIALPFGIKPGYSPNPAAQPSIQVIGLLLVMVGLPFFAVSAQAPLIQRWFAQTKDPAAKDPYFLYSASNLGSMLALLAYPALVEPKLTLHGQSTLWTGGYVALGLLTAGSAIVSLTSKRVETVEEADQEPSVNPTSETRLRWVLLSAAPSSLMLGATSYITTNLAPIPLLWIIPLALYLVTFILAFSNRVRNDSFKLTRLASMLALAVAFVLTLELWEPIFGMALLHLVVFFFLAWGCHTLLARSRPSAAYLTEYYLWISVGGVLGGAFNAFVAPLAFTWLYEYPIAIGLALAVMRARGTDSKRTVIRDLAVGFVAAAIIALIVFQTRNSLGWWAAVTRNEDIDVLVIEVVAVLMLIGCFLTIDRPIRYGIVVASLMIMGRGMRASTDIVRLETRNFFGTKRVFDNRPFRQLVHGNTVHGQQFVDPAKHSIPLTYYHPNSPIGQVFKEFSGPRAKHSVALVGMGTGTLATYGHEADHFTFYEIDPQIIAIATNPNYFTYISDSKAKIDTVLGDARLELAKAPASSYGLIILDAFSSDSVPIHLLTREAVQMYLSKLEPDGLLAFHVSNRYLDLPPVLARIANSLGLECRYQEGALRGDEKDMGMVESHWVLMARKKSDLGKMGSAFIWRNMADVGPGPIWTDDFSNVLGAFRRD